jgi:hypothetical protein
MKCLNCGAPLPKGSTVRRKYCGDACRVHWNKRNKNPEIDAKSKVPPRTTITGDPEVDKILKLDTATTLQNTLLKDYLERRDERVRQEALEGADKWKEERVLDATTAKRVGDWLAEQFDPS